MSPLRNKVFSRYRNTASNLVASRPSCGVVVVTFLTRVGEERCHLTYWLVDLSHRTGWVLQPRYPARLTPLFALALRGFSFSCRKTYFLVQSLGR